MPASITQWTGLPIAAVATWSSLTPPANRNLVTISELGSFTLNTVAGVIINVGYNPNLVDGWSKV